MRVYSRVLLHCIESYAAVIDRIAFQELADKDDVLYIPGGATQGSVRVTQWLLKTPGSTSYYGCIGKDDFGDKMQAYCKRDGVDVSVDRGS